VKRVLIDFVLNETVFKFLHSPQSLFCSSSAAESA